MCPCVLSVRISLLQPPYICADAKECIWHIISIIIHKLRVKSINQNLMAQCLLFLQEDRENIIRARESGKGALTNPFRLLESKHLGVVFTFAVYSVDLPADATKEDRIKATAGYIDAFILYESCSIPQTLQPICCK